MTSPCIPGKGGKPVRPPGEKSEGARSSEGGGKKKPDVVTKTWLMTVNAGEHTLRTPFLEELSLVSNFS